MTENGSTNQVVWTKITVRSYAWSFAIQIQIQAVCLSTFYRKNQLNMTLSLFTMYLKMLKNTPMSATYADIFDKAYKVIPR